MAYFSPLCLLTHLSSYPPTRRFWVAYSGGLDSHVLLQALVYLRDAGYLSTQIHAVHIHHGLQKQADNWAKHCQQVCARWVVPYELIAVKIPKIHRESLEAQARTARYSAVAQRLAPGEIVLTAHHADDQAETVLLQLLRGAGSAGLAAMPQLAPFGSGWLGRPLLSYTRTQLNDYAHQAQLHWLEDNSNFDQRFDRNFLRQDIIPRLKQRWPSLSRTLGRVAHHQAEANALIQAQAQADWYQCRGDTSEQLNLFALTALTPTRQRYLLRFWIKQLGLPVPSTNYIQRILDEVVTAQVDRQPLVRWRGGEIRRYRHHLFAMPNLPTVPQFTMLSWSLPTRCRLPWGWLMAYPTQKQGLVIPEGTCLQIRFRQGGEKFYQHGQHHTVKKLLQAIHLPPWLRPFLPLIYWNDQLIAIPEIGVCDAFKGQKTGDCWIVQWHYSAIEGSIDSTV